MAEYGSTEFGWQEKQGATATNRYIMLLKLIFAAFLVMAVYEGTRLLKRNRHVTMTAYNFATWQQQQQQQASLDAAMTKRVAPTTTAAVQQRVPPHNSNDLLQEQQTSDRQQQQMQLRMGNVKIAASRMEGTGNSGENETGDAAASRKDNSEGANRTEKHYTLDFSSSSDALTSTT